MKSTMYAGGALLALLLLSGIGLAQDKKEDHKSEAKPETYDLSIKFVKGQKSRYKTKTVVTTSSEVMGQKTENENTNGGTTVFECTGVDEDGNASVVMSYDKLTVKIVSNDATSVDYDSERDKVEDVDENYRPVVIMKDYKFTATVSPEGKATAVEGWDEYIKGAKKVANPETADLFASILTDQSIRDAVEWLYYPNHKDAVKPGDSWEQKSVREQKMIGEITSTRKYTFKEVAEKAGRLCAHLTLEGDMKGKEDSNYQYTDVDWKGNVWVDLKTREIVSDHNVLKYTLKMKLGSMEIKAPSEVNTTMDLITEDNEDAETPKDGKKDADGGK
ncbi:MAG: hypothetical protein KDB82_08605 [Planctomycetes bacterium]|nr:hypothetical protein [Planctomycetota bacterium]